jgi:hypothetical protein
MMGFKAFHSAQATIAGIDAAHMMRKGQLAEENMPAYKQFMALATIECGMININPSFFHDLCKGAIRNAIPDIKENRIKNNVFGKVCPFKADYDFMYIGK